MIKAIETRYKGYRFRSRLEARWAVFFDALGIQWEYEKEGFDLGKHGWYLPDFWLPSLNCWVEIKGADADLEEIRKCTILAAEHRAVVLFCGLPGEDSFGRCYCFDLSDSSSGFIDEGWECTWGQCPDASISLLALWDRPRGFFSGPVYASLGMGTLYDSISVNDFIRNAYRAARSARFEHGEGRR